MAEKYPNRSKGSMSEVVKYIDQYVTMYFTNAERTLIAAHSVQLSVSSEASVTDLVTILTGKLAAGISGEDALEPVLPADFTLAREPRIGVAGMEEEETDAESSAEKNTSKDKTGEASSTSAPSSLPLFAPKVIYITIKQPKNDYDEQLMCAALTLTLTGYLPGISGIVLYVEAEDGTRTLGGADTGKGRQRLALQIGPQIALAVHDTGTDRADILLHEPGDSFPCTAEPYCKSRNTAA